ncbi:hypothetical protein I3760_13G100900 [Carya illinoinensis]|nr:hypothetical protein I3760_13G100900 [Carya illinoinensis]
MSSIKTSRASITQIISSSTHGKQKLSHIPSRIWRSHREIMASRGRKPGREKQRRRERGEEESRNSNWGSQTTREDKKLSIITYRNRIGNRSENVGGRKQTGYLAREKNTRDGGHLNRSQIHDADVQ